jgi:hypothetical protein
MRNGFICNTCGMPLDCNKKCELISNEIIRKFYSSCQCFRCFLKASKTLEYNYAYVLIRSEGCYNNLDHTKQLNEYRMWFDGILVAREL